MGKQRKIKKNIGKQGGTRKNIGKQGETKGNIGNMRKHGHTWENKVAVIKTKSATIAFFFLSSIPSPRPFFSAVPFLCYCDFGAS